MMELRERLARVALDAAEYDPGDWCGDEEDGCEGGPLTWDDANEAGRAQGYRMADAVLADAEMVVIDRARWEQFSSLLEIANEMFPYSLSSDDMAFIASQERTT